jgi:hypothetical protein
VGLQGLDEQRPPRILEDCTWIKRSVKVFIWEFSIRRMMEGLEQKKESVDT